MNKIPNSKQIHNWLKSKYDIRKTNISGCIYFSHKGFPDYFVVGLGFVEIKRGNEKITDEQKEWIKILKGFIYRFWHSHVEIFDKDLVLIQIINL